MDPWVYWLIGAVVATFVELAVTTFFIAPFGVGALAGMVVSLFTSAWVLPWVAFAIVTLGAFLLLRPLAHKNLRHPPTIMTGTDALVGRAATVTEAIDNHGDQGKVKIDEGEVWTARAADGAGALPEGARVRITEIRGVTAIVEPQ